MLVSGTIAVFRANQKCHKRSQYYKLDLLMDVRRSVFVQHRILYHMSITAKGYLMEETIQVFHWPDNNTNLNSI